jgi:hypothetical protein
MRSIESKSLWFLVNTHVKLFLHEQSMRWWLWPFFLKIYLLMPFDAFNGSLVEQCLILGCRSEISDTFTHSRKREGKITKMGQGVVTGLTGDRHRSDRCQRNKWNLGRWPGTGTRVTRYASVCCRVTRGCPDPQEEGWFGVKVSFVCASQRKLLISATSKRTSKS